LCLYDDANILFQSQLTDGNIRFFAFVYTVDTMVFPFTAMQFALTFVLSKSIETDYNRNTLTKHLFLFQAI